MHGDEDDGDDDGDDVDDDDDDDDNDYVYNPRNYNNDQNNF